MFTYTHNAAKHYAMINLESNALVADPHKLISMLFEGAVIALNQAEFDIKNDKLTEKFTSISKAIDIILLGLDASLKYESGNKLGENLHMLYQYMAHQLTLANLHNDINRIQEVRHLINELRGAWNAIDPNVNVATMRRTPAANESSAQNFARAL
ncbi:flagellar export chaperone FliS [Polynucleobacter cosmopolitanus]|uniref:Flagellar secretion chaperone FliS n=1 Tax=Polynucleobacter cosmopolitanus TaxID=351345 RepID=A0A229FU76_9BURK|nr:flagellar export chaperone FliS [Polynucleobacter cosmopolitanus]OXL15545.1 flagellar export chaperone FliS [Polynucleobacter cosmopolitanus]